MIADEKRVSVWEQLQTADDDGVAATQERLGRQAGDLFWQIVRTAEGAALGARTGGLDLNSRAYELWLNVIAFAAGYGKPETEAEIIDWLTEGF